MRSEHTDIRSLLWANPKALSEPFMVSSTAFLLFFSVNIWPRFTGTLVLMCEWFLTSKKTERRCLCLNGTCIYQKSLSGNLPGLLCERGYWLRFKSWPANGVKVKLAFWNFYCCIKKLQLRNTELMVWRLAL